MAVVLSLESFDIDRNNTSTQAFETQVSYDDGFKDGEAAATALFSKEQVTLRSVVVEALSDSTFGYQEAQTHFLNGIQEYLNTILNSVIPAILCHAFHAQLRDILRAALLEDVTSPIILRLPPNQLGAFAAIIDDLGCVHVDIQSDSDLTDHAAFFAGPGGETSLDLDALLENIKEYSAIMLQPSQKVS